MGVGSQRGRVRESLTQLQIREGEEERGHHHSECSYAERQTDANREMATT